MGISEYVKANEKTHEKGKIIKYIFCEGSDSNQLIITFPGFAGMDQPPKYNYIRTLKNTRCNRLFILDDYGPRGSYLIGEARDNSIEESVISLIEDICEKYDIKKENIISIGTSKGGYCALYYGIKYHFGYVIAGAPQTLLGDYLSSFPEISDYIAGGHEPKDRSYLNSLLYDLVENSEDFPEIYIQVGAGDHHYTKHIIPFCRELNKKNVNHKLEVKNYFTHSLTGHYYITYLQKTLNDIDESIGSPKSENETNSIKSENGQLVINCTSQNEDLKYLFELYNVHELLIKTNYQESPSFKYPLNSKGTYHAKIYTKNHSKDTSRITDEIEVQYDETIPGIEELYKLSSRSFLEKKVDGIRYNTRSSFSNIFNLVKSGIILKKHYLKIKKNSNKRYKFTIKSTHTDEEFAWYILRNGEKIDTIWYRPEPFLDYNFQESGNYQLKYFVKDKKSKQMYTSKVFVVSTESIDRNL